MNGNIFCRGGDWSVSTNPKGGCGKQKDHIRKKYNNKIESLKAFVVDTQNVLEAQKEEAEKAEQEFLSTDRFTEDGGIDGYGCDVQAQLTARTIFF